MRISFQGVHGAYSELAGQYLFGKKATFLPVQGFEDVFASVTQKKAQFGVIPIENSLAGSIHQNYDLLLAHSLHIVGEIHARIEHSLMCLPSSSRRKILNVRSHPQALAQCRTFFLNNPRLKAEPYFDTAGAAKSLVDEHLAESAAIAGAHAAKLYGLKILKRNIESRKNNFTRFLAVARSPAKLSIRAKAKTSLVFSPRNNQTGILHRILGVFSVRNIDLLKIESRPDPNRAFQYLFYVDLEGSTQRAQVADALGKLSTMTKKLRILGTYPMGKGNFYGAQ